MGFLRIVKFSTKALICGSAVYYTNEFGIWGRTQQTEEGYARLKSTIQVSSFVYSIQIRVLHFIPLYLLPDCNR